MIEYSLGVQVFLNSKMFKFKSTHDGSMFAD
jgi:hypothetical protein